MNNLTTINIPNNVKTIGSNAFASDTNLKSITIPNSVEKIDYCAFYKCTGITTFNIPTNVSNIDEYAFSECNFTTVKFANDCKITTGYIPNVILAHTGDDAITIKIKI